MMKNKIIYKKKGKTELCVKIVLNILPAPCITLQNRIKAYNKPASCCSFKLIKKTIFGGGGETTVRDICI